MRTKMERRKKAVVWQGYRCAKCKLYFKYVAQAETQCSDGEPHSLPFEFVLDPRVGE